jgi:hypothetical protein
VTKNTEIKNQALDLFKKASGGDAEALIFIVRFDEYMDDVTEFVCRGPYNPTVFLKLLARTNVLYSLSFYVKHAPFLQLHVNQVLMGLADGLDGQNSHEEWRRNWSEVSKLAFVELILAIATIKLGFNGARELSYALRHLAWASRTSLTKAAE